MKKKDNSKFCTELDMEEFAHELFPELERAATQKGLLAELITQTGMTGSVSGDEAWLRDTCLFLFEHCVQASRNGTLTFAVTTEKTDGGGGMVRISVSETGNGFTQEQLEALKSRKECAGDEFLSGLHEIGQNLKKIGGRLKVYSVYGGGAIYYVKYPCRIFKEAEEKQDGGLHNLRRERKAKQEESLWINRKLALEYAGGMEEMRLEMLGIYYDQAVRYLDELPKLFEAQDWEKYRIVVHAIKGNSLGIGAQDFSQEAYEQEMAAKNGDIGKIQRDFSEFYEHYRLLVNEVKRQKP